MGHKPEQMAEQSSNSVDLVNEFSMDDIDHLAEFIFDDASPEFELPETCSRAAPAIDAGITVLKRCRGDAGEDAQLATDALSSNSVEPKRPKIASKERNREAAAKSRHKKTERMKTLEKEVCDLQQDHSALKQANATGQLENSALRAQVNALSELLFRIGSSVGSEEMKKVTVGIVSTVACATVGTGWSADGAVQMPHMKMLVGRAVSNAGWDWSWYCSCIALFVAICVSTVALRQSLCSSNHHHVETSNRLKPTGTAVPHPVSEISNSDCKGRRRQSLQR